MKTSLAGESASCRKEGRRSLRPGLLAGFAFLLAGVPVAGFAQDRVLIDDLGNPPPELRRAELRKALVHGSEGPFAASDRRKMSEAERDALHRDLRNAMRGAYRDGEKRGRESN